VVFDTVVFMRPTMRKIHLGQGKTHETGYVDADQIAVIGTRDGREQPIPDVDLPPADEAVVAGGRRTIALRDVGPGRAGA